MVECCRASSGAHIRPGQWIRDWDEAEEWHAPVCVVVQRNQQSWGTQLGPRVRGPGGWVPRAGTVGELKIQIVNWCFIADFFPAQISVAIIRQINNHGCWKKKRLLQ